MKLSNVILFNRVPSRTVQLNISLTVYIVCVLCCYCILCIKQLVLYCFHLLIVQVVLSVTRNQYIFYQKTMLQQIICETSCSAWVNGVITTLITGRKGAFFKRKKSHLIVNQSDTSNNSISYYYRSQRKKKTLSRIFSFLYLNTV